MAFGFDDFAKLFDPVSDLLGTSGKKGVGLLQQDPEDLAMLAALAAGGYGALTAVPGAAGIAAAGPSAALVTPEIAALAPEVASLGAEEAARLAAEETARIAAQEAAQSGILQADQMNPELLNSINGPGMQTADAGGSFLDRFYTKGVDLNPPDYRALNTEQLFAQDAAKASLNNVPPGLEAEINSQYYGQNLGGDMGPGIKDAALNANTAQYPLSPSSNLGPTAEEYRLLAENTARYPSGGPTGPSPEMTEFYQALNERSAAAPPSTIQQFENPASTTQSVFRGNPAEAGFQPPQVSRGGYFNNGIDGGYTDTLTPFERGMDTAGRYFDKAADYVEKNPYKSAGLAYYGAYKTGMLDQPAQEPIADNYKNPYSMAGFRRSSPSPSAYRYRPRYAQGGIASVHSYAKGGRSKSKSAMDFYDAMNPQQESAPLSHGSPGIYYDADPDTRYLDPMEAAMVRMSKLNSRTNVQAPTMAPSRRMGELDFKPVAAAQGGIMGYADGGAPLEDDLYIRLTGRNDRADRVPGPDAPFSPTSESAAAVSKFGQGMKDYPAIAPGGIAAQVIGAIASSYGDHLARNVDPNYGHEAMNTSASKDLGLPSINADDDNSVALGLNGSGNASVSSSDFGGGSFDPAGRDSDGTPLAKGGIASIHTPYNLGGYAAGGNPRLLRGPGDGMSDNIPATINNRQPARLADGEYVITADVVSHLGNGSTEAGAKQLDAMMKRIRKGRTGTSKQGKQINPRKYLPA